MTSKMWFYKRGDDEKGPVSSEELKSLFEEGVVKSDTKVRFEGQDKWVDLSSVFHFGGEYVDEPTAGIREKELEDATHTALTTRSKPHPWHRFWARMIDYFIFSLVLGGVIGLGKMPLNHILPPFSGIGVLFLWCFIEAGFLCSWQTTLGKYLFHIKIVSDKKIKYLDALSRSLSVWWLGLAIGFPYISIITLIVAYVKLKTNRVTSWDRRGKFEVVHGKIGPIRATLITVILALLLGFILWFNLFFRVISIPSWLTWPIG